MMTGSVGMCICETVIGAIVATCASDWSKHVAAGWVAVGESSSLSPQTKLNHFNTRTPSLRMALHHQLRLFLGSWILDPHRRNLPDLHTREGDIDWRVC